MENNHSDKEPMNMNRRSFLRMTASAAAAAGLPMPPGVPQTLKSLGYSVTKSLMPIYQSPQVRSQCMNLLGFVPNSHDRAQVISELAVAIKKEEDFKNIDSTSKTIVLCESRIEIMNAHELCYRTKSLCKNLLNEWQTSSENDKNRAKFMEEEDFMSDEDGFYGSDYYFVQGIIDLFASDNSKSVVQIMNRRHEHKVSDWPYKQFGLDYADDEVLDDFAHQLSDASSLIHQAFRRSFLSNLDIGFSYWEAEYVAEKQQPGERNIDATGDQGSAHILSTINAVSQTLAGQIQAVIHQRELQFAQLTKGTEYVDISSISANGE